MLLIGHGQTSYEHLLHALTASSPHGLWLSTVPSTCLSPLSRGRHHRLRLAPPKCRHQVRVCRVSVDWPYIKSDPLSDRLPTVSASEALLSLQSRGPRSISTGLDRLNAILGTSKAGLGRGNLTDIWGPAGSGKTSLAYLSHPLLPSINAKRPADYRLRHMP